VTQAKNTKQGKSLNIRGKADFKMVELRGFEPPTS